MTLYNKALIANRDNRILLHETQLVFACNRFWSSYCMEPPFVSPKWA